MAIEIRPENPRDIQAIRAVHVTSFPTAAEGQLVDALRAAGHLSISLVGIEEKEVVGHVAFSPVAVSGVIDGIGLAPVAVRPESRRRGIAERLIRTGLTECQRMDRGFVVVLGDPRYYRRFGFSPAARWGLKDEYGGGEAFQAIEIRAGSIPSGGGVVRYVSEFTVPETDGAA
jgi:putative acetyltransferase